MMPMCSLNKHLDFDILSSVAHHLKGMIKLGSHKASDTKCKDINTTKGNFCQSNAKLICPSIFNHAW